jgi:hypothetical protein
MLFLLFPRMVSAAAKPEGIGQVGDEIQILL